MTCSEGKHTLMADLLSTRTLQFTIVASAVTMAAHAAFGADGAALPQRLAAANIERETRDRDLTTTLRSIDDDARPARVGVPADDIAAAVLDRLQNERRGASAEARDEQKAIRAVYEMRKGRPLWVNGVGLAQNGAILRTVLADAGSWALDPADYTLDLDMLDGRADAGALAKAELILTRAALDYAGDARGGRVDPSALSYDIFVEPPIKPTAEVLTDIIVAEDVQAYFEGLHPQHAQFKILRESYLALLMHEDKEPSTDLIRGTSKRKAAEKRSNTAERQTQIRRLKLNMEIWRWMPEELGDTHILANIPAFRVRLRHDGKTVFSERVIVGKGETQTPLFSDEMDHLVIRPYWNVPNSIKVKSYLPGLLRGRNSLARNGLRIKQGSREINPGAVNWSRADIRNYHVYQPPGPGNALGNVKFMFPNKHAVYMHDTPMKHLFKNDVRPFSAGCVRVRNPEIFAKRILGIANGWTDAETAQRYDNGPDNDRVDLETHIPVHIGYFTAWGDPETGAVEYFDDVYKHEQHLAYALAGDYGKIVKRKRSVSADFQRITSSVRPVNQTSSGGGWFGSGFGSSGTSTPRSRWVGNAFGSDN